MDAGMGAEVSGRQSLVDHVWKGSDRPRFPVT